eukprot:snap_masked-scaffold1159_size58420-processed-gene-0.4 protein:Tk06246 transcript:snap_masked-scaffold1159_size58420-processed-gene-0.4-mRNA-1 annotation:"general transcription factor iif subunit 1 isoform x1"
MDHLEPFCAQAGQEGCATYPVPINCPTTEEELEETLKATLFAVKTCEKFHEERLTVIQETWGPAAVNVIYVSEKEDPQFDTLRLPGLRNTERGHCNKTMSIVNYFRAHARERGWQWLVIADDDTILSVGKLASMLRCYDPQDLVAIGQRYGFRIATGQHGYDYPTGGSSMIFSLPLIEKMADQKSHCRCPSEEHPDDMLLGACLTNMGISLTHSKRLHQGRPEDYHEKLLAEHDPVSFHKFWQTDPVKTYRKWFAEWDELPRRIKFNRAHPHQDLLLVSMAEQVQEFTIKLPTRNERKKFHILKYNASLKIDPTNWSQVRMVRENNKKEHHRGPDEEAPKQGAGSEFGREQREEARRKKYGYSSKKYNPDAQPWLMRIGSKKEGRQYRGLRDGGVSDNTTYYVFTHAQDGSFEAHPVSEWYNFTPRVTYKTLNAEEAEEKFAERGKILNHFAIMVNKKLRGDQAGGNDEDLDDEGGKKGKAKKGPGGKKEFKISDMDDWVDSDGGLNSDSEQEKEKSEDEDDAGKKKGRSKDSKKKNRKKDEADSEGNEDSDDGDGEGREVDYMSDESSESDEELQEQANTKGVDQDEGLSKMLDSDESEEEENKDKEKEGEEDDDPDKAKKKKKKKAKDGEASNEDSDEGKGKGASQGNSRAGTPGPGDAEDKDNDEKNQRAEKRKALVDSVLDPMESSKKKMRMEQFSSSQGSSGNVDASIEEDVRRYLARKQMTTTELLKKFKSKKTGLGKDELMQQLVEALRKINPQKKKVKGVMYLFLKNIMDSIKTNYGLDDPMIKGIQRNKDLIQSGHPLEQSEKYYRKNLEKSEMAQLRSLQGLHAPLRLQMERAAVSKVGHLPCITSRANLLADVLTGRDETIGFDDIYGQPEHCEGLTMPHHAIERHLGTL